MKRLLLSYCCLLLLFLVWELPARLVVDTLLAPRLATGSGLRLVASGVAGSWRQGDCWLLQAGEIILQDLHWQLAVPDLAVGRLAGNIAFSLPGDQGSCQARATFSPWAGLSQLALDGQLELAGLTRLGLANIFAGGRLRLEQVRFLLRDNWPEKAGGSLRLENLRLAGGKVRLGTLTGSLAMEGRTLVLSLGGAQGGPAAVKGALRLQPDGRYRLNLRLVPKPGEDALIAALKPLGRADPAGDGYQLRFAGVLRLTPENP